MTSNKYRVMKRLFVAATLAGGVSCFASAGDFYSDNSGSRLGGDAYAYFNSKPVDKLPSKWRAENPNGEPERWYQSNSVSGGACNPAPILTNAPSDPIFKQTHPNGLTEAELQALSSEGPAWHSGPTITNTSLSVALQPSTGATCCSPPPATSTRMVRADPEWSHLPPQQSHRALRTRVAVVRLDVIT